jgi:sugar phosphate isomerase/epimerase
VWDRRLSVNSLSSRELSLAEDLALYERLGLARVTLWLPKLVEAGLEKAVDEVLGRHLMVDGLLPGASFDLAHPSAWAETRDLMIQAVEVAERLGAPSVQTTGGRAGGLLFERAAERFGEALEPVRAEASRRGRRLALEPTRPQFAHVGFVHTLADGCSLAEGLDLWLVPDAAHLWWEPGLLERLESEAGRWAAVQLADLVLDQPVLERVVPGDGQVPLGPIMEAASAGGFEGPFELELIGSAVEAEGYERAIRRSLEHLHGLLAVVGGPPDGELPFSRGG